MFILFSGLDVGSPEFRPTEPFGLFGKVGKSSHLELISRGSGVAKQRIRIASGVDQSLGNSQSENGNSLDSAEIAALAYHLWKARGCPEGSPEVDWLDAEQQIRARLDEAAAPQISEPILVRRSGA